MVRFKQVCMYMALQIYGIKFYIDKVYFFTCHGEDLWPLEFWEEPIDIQGYFH